MMLRGYTGPHNRPWRPAENLDGLRYGTIKQRFITLRCANNYAVVSQNVMDKV
jgi:hypothetical protein